MRKIILYLTQGRVVWNAQVSLFLDLSEGMVPAYLIVLRGNSVPYFIGGLLLLPKMAGSKGVGEFVFHRGFFGCSFFNAARWWPEA